MSLWFSCVFAGVVIVATHTEKLLECLGVPMNLAFVALMLDDLVSHEDLRGWFVFLFLQFCFFAPACIKHMVY